MTAARPASTAASSAAAGVTGAWEVVIGLEVHCELSTATKLFCGCPNVFGGEPNTNVCPVCLGLPGSLPVLNRRAVEYAMRLGEALHCRIEPSIFHRKNYFYPDMPKDYQTTQYDEPINVDGFLELPDGSRVGIVRAHMEEDTGKTTHVGGGGRIHEADWSLVDYNRAGVPLMEIVSEPDIRSAEQARAYVGELRAILAAIGVSDARMEEGSLRVDANVSVHRPDEPYGTRCEVKNMNSLRSLGRAIEHEAARQIALLGAGETVRQETRHWDEDDGRTHSLRSKEEAEDYRYFPEPDLLPVVPEEAWLDEVRSSLPPLPAERRQRLAAAAAAGGVGVGRVGVEGVGVEPAAAALVVERGLDDLVLAAAGLGADVGRALTHAEHNLSADAARTVTPEAFATLIAMETGGKLTATQAKQVLAEMAETGAGPEEIARAHGFEAMADDALEQAVDSAIAADPEAWQSYRSGNDKAAGALVGQVMKATRGQADGKAVTRLLQERRTSA